ncbi:Sarcosine/dimethylglycine N-methyltransferase [Rubripirellula obstinata]|uniref:Sarcosine/dimethylglycine N-methyltransferase n=1 Tax=Rubripirellula obstinata TaxID=406547 RepID=A0A5B1CEU1_9BACT|nr:methyltransferase domain-containing protein [Rubripirellula obstinata]KAA1258395.1 Sarcosine/dimethylglycine N-methyltransferase [Rubripirellula obstinata]
MSLSAYDTATETARRYYNSSDADTFYAEIWGGEDIHIGIYQSPDEPISRASHRTVEHLTQRLSGINESSVILDIGSGYGGAARHLARHFGCRVIGLNLSETENARHRQLNQQAGLEDRIEVIDGAFESIPLDDDHVDVVWSQDAILHSGDRERVLREVNRVLRSGGQFVFTDPMRADDCPAESLTAILQRIHLSDLGSTQFYQRAAEQLGWQDRGFEAMPEQLINHYSRVLEMTDASSVALAEKVSASYLERMKVGLRHWIDGGRAGRLNWGVFLFQKS